MSSAADEHVEDRKGLLAEDDHMAGMERLEMEVVSISRPFPSVTRVTATIAPSSPEAWKRPNIAIRLELPAPDGGKPVSRVYTVRAFDAERSAIEIDFVMHADESPAMHWLEMARTGSRIHLTGPRGHYLPNYAPGKRPVLLADETAIPAVYAILQDWPAGAEGTVYIETPDIEAFEELPNRPGVSKYLLLRQPDQAPGSTGRLVEAARAIADPAAHTFWAAGERREARAIRKYLTENHGLGREDVRVFGYWKRGTSSSEIDRVRLRHYEDMTARGEGIAQFEDIDIPI